MAEDTSRFRNLQDTARETDQALRLSEARFRALAESASEAILTIDAKSTILFVNRAAETIFGYSMQEMLGRKVTMLMPEYLRLLHQTALDRYNHTGHKHLDWACVQLPGLHKNGHEIPVELSIAEHFEAGEKRFTGILRDITERKKSELVVKQQTAVIQLLQSVAIAANEASTVEEAFASALARICAHTGAELGHVYFTSGGRDAELSPSKLWYANPPEGFEKFRTITENTKMKLGEGLPGRVASRAKPLWIRDINKAENFPRNRTREMLGLRSAFAFPVPVKGEVVAVLEFFSSQEKEPDEQLLEAMNSIGAQLGRVVERKRVEESLKHLSTRLMRSQDEERRRIGRELHDSAGQYLAALQMNLDMLHNEVSGLKGRTPQLLAESIDLVQRCSAEIRTLSYLLHPPLLEEAGLGVTVSWYVEGFSKRSGIPVTLEIPPDLGRLRSDMELAVFRILQESLTNIHRHSGSKTATVRMISQNNALVLEIGDRGKGIPEKASAEPAKSPGVGIAGMRERLSEIGGELQLSSDTNGTLVRAKIPIIPR